MVHTKPGGVVAKHSGLWTRRREFESLPGYHFPILKNTVCARAICRITTLLVIWLNMQVSTRKLNSSWKFNKTKGNQHGQDTHQLC